ncbi:hypothetical protein GCM10010272_01230 [Streptomyces lateritius]|nr:hypothetical protein GCM10010272_01230 [Streptomyces lateritius]
MIFEALRQGEIFGLPVDEAGFLTGWLPVGYQVKLSGGRAVFAPPKRGKVRDVPLFKRVASPRAWSGSRRPRSRCRGSPRTGRW